MGFLSQRYVPHCCLVYLTEKQKYLTKIIKCDEELILKDIGSIDIFKEKIVKGEFLENDIFLYERSQNGSEVYVWECNPTKKNKFGEYFCEEKPIDIFFGIGQGRVYVEEGRFNTKDEGKKKLLDNNGYLIDNPKYRFREYEKDNNLFRYCKLG
jgi:hypothetical protein